MTDRQEIQRKYLKPPTIDQILGFIEELDVSYAAFERYFEMYDGVIREVKCGAKPLPVKYWPIFYERVVPKYGLKYLSVTIAKSVAKKPITSSSSPIKLEKLCQTT